MAAPTYRPEIFRVRNLDEAKKIILTPEATTTTDERWEKETPYLAGELVEALAPGPDSVLLDYGCGVGRLAKELIVRTGCTVVGIDISPDMRVLSHLYVASPRFLSCSPAGLARLAARGLRVDAAYSVWVLQHCFKPAEDIALINAALAEAGRLTVINSRHRVVPTDQGWKNDGLDILALLGERFEEIGDKPLAEGVVSDKLRSVAFNKLFRRRPAGAAAGGSPSP